MLRAAGATRGWRRGSALRSAGTAACCWSDREQPADTAASCLLSRPLTAESRPQERTPRGRGSAWTLVPGSLVSLREEAAAGAGARSRRLVAAAHPRIASPARSVDQGECRMRLRDAEAILAGDRPEREDAQPHRSLPDQMPLEAGDGSRPYGEPGRWFVSRFYERAGYQTLRRTRVKRKSNRPGCEREPRSTTRRPCGRRPCGGCGRPRTRTGRSRAPAGVRPPRAGTTR